MNILVAKNGSQLGPFSETDLRAKLAAGEFAPTDYGWHEGLTAWSPLSQLLGSAPALSPVAPPSVPSASPQPSYAPQVQNAPGGYAPQPVNSPYPATYQQGGGAAWGTPAASGYAGFWLRAVALFIDGLIVGIPLQIAGAMLRAIGLDPLTAAVLMLPVNILGVWFYYAKMESSASQATLGKTALGLKVTDENGARISFGQATGRHFSKFVSVITIGIGYIMAGITQRKQALHDLMAHTLVVKK